jgi:hypothetical protein
MHMPASDAEALCVFRDAMRDFVEFADGLTKSGQTIWGDDQGPLRHAGALVQTLYNLRQPALVAGVHVGETREAMDMLIRGTIHVCGHDFFQWQKEQVTDLSPLNRLQNQLNHPFSVFADLIAIAISRKPPSPVTVTKNRKVLRDKVTEARDKWIYSQCLNPELTYDSISRALKRDHSEWDHIESPQGIRAAAQRYADRHGRKRPPRRIEQS